MIVVNLRIVVNLVILKKSADSDETDDFVYYLVILVNIANIVREDVKK